MVAGEWWCADCFNGKGIGGKFEYGNQKDIDLAAYKADFEAGMEPADLAAKHGISAKSTWYFGVKSGASSALRRRHTRKGPKRPEARLAVLKQLNAEGLVDRAIGEQLGVCGETVRRLRQEAGLPANDTRGGGWNWQVALAKWDANRKSAQG
jgi:hypothetical protein